MAARCSFARDCRAPPAAFWPWPNGCPPGPPGCPPGPPPLLSALLSALIARGLPAAGRDPIAVCMIVAMSWASVCSSRMIRTSLTAPLSTLITSICRINSATSAMSRGLACTIRELVRASAMTRTAGLNPPRATKTFWIVVYAAVAEAYLRWKTWNWAPGTAGWSRRAMSSFTFFTFSATANDQDRVGHRQGRDAHGALPRQIDFVIQGFDQGRHGLAFDVLHHQDVDRRLGFWNESFDLPHDFHQLLHVLRAAPEDQHVEPVDHFHLHRVYDPGKVAEFGRLFAGRAPARAAASGRWRPGSRRWAGGRSSAARRRGVGPRLHEQGRQGQWPPARRWPFA